MNEISKSEQWDMEIKPHDNLFNLHLKDVWNYRDLLGLLVRRDFVSFYKQTIFGPVWLFVQPIFTTITFTIIFSRLAKISTDDIPAPLFYLTGNIAWNYFSDCLNKSSSVFRDNASIFGKVYFPRLIMPISIVISNLVRFCIQFLLFLCMIVYFALQGHSLHPNLYILLFPFIIFLMAILGLGLGMIISAMTTKYRDLTFLLSFGIQLLMYATPIIYPLSAAPVKYRMYIALNPLSGLIETFRYGFTGKGIFSLNVFLYSIVVSILLFFLGLVVFNRVEKTFVDTV